MVFTIFLVLLLMKKLDSKFYLAPLKLFPNFEVISLNLFRDPNPGDFDPENTYRKMPVSL